MSADLAAALLTAFLLVIGYAVATRLAPRIGLEANPVKAAHSLPANRRRVFYGCLGFGLLVAGVELWAFIHGGRLAGYVLIGLLVVVFIVPSLVMVPLRLRNSREQAAEARRRRVGDPNRH